MHSLKPVFSILLLLIFSVDGFSQDNYEIQVYGSQTMNKGKTMLELHSNFTIAGIKETDDGTIPTHHALHETFEITYGFNSWFEVGFYIFTSNTPAEGFSWVGDHIRPRVRIPEEWKWPVGLSLSTEFGYQQRAYSTDSWTWEIRPIIDKTFFEKLYCCFNPAVDRSFKGVNVNAGFTFSPNAKISYKITPVIIPGIEYYGSLGPFSGFDMIQKQQQQIVTCLDLNVSPDWELNFGALIGVTNATDKMIIKIIAGRRF